MSARNFFWSWFLVLVTSVGTGVCSAAASALDGDPPSTVRASVAADGAQADAESTGSVLSADGRHVAFVSWATNLVENDTNNFADVFVKDLHTGDVVRASVGAGGVQAQGDSHSPSISADGRYLAFVTEASNLVWSDANRAPDVFVHDLVAGTTVRASVSSGGAPANHSSGNASISGDGRYVVFESLAQNLVALDQNGCSDIFVRDLVQGTTERVSVTHSGAEANGGSEVPAISADGRYVAFSSLAQNLVQAEAVTAKLWHVYLRDRTAATTVRISVSPGGGAGTASSGAPVVSADGRYVAFESMASNLVPNDANGFADIFLRDVQLATTVRVSAASGAGPDGPSVHASISADGRYVAYSSKASNLVSGDANGEQDVFLWDRVLSTTIVASPGGTGSGGSSLWASLSADGRFVAFPSSAVQLVAQDSNGVPDVFVHGPLH